VEARVDALDSSNRLLDEGGDASGLAGAVEAIVGVLGIDDAETAPIATPEISDADIEALVSRRQRARADRDFAEADRIREELASAGVSIEDGPNGSRWIRT